MSEKPKPDIRVIVRDDGSIDVPAGFVQSQGIGPGTHVLVRITEPHIAERLRARGVTEEMVDVITDRQMEARENVLAFLASEGVVDAGSRTHGRWKRWLSSWK